MLESGRGTVVAEGGDVEPDTTGGTEAGEAFA